MAQNRRVLDSLDLLPPECEDDVVWALARLNERQRTQADILFELNDRLAVKGQGPISKSAFSRRSVRLKRRRDRLAERRVRGADARRAELRAARHAGEQKDAKGSACRPRH